MARKKTAKDLTEAFVERMRPGERAWDGQAHGLIADRGVKGVAWRVQADFWKDGKLVGTRKATIGKWPALSVKAARAAAAQWLGALHGGHDPKEAQRATGEMWTLAQAIDAYAADAAKARGQGAERTVDDMRYRAKKYLSDWLARPLTEITALECRMRHDAIVADVRQRGQRANATGERAANAALGDVRAVWALAARTFPDRLRAEANPVRAVRFSKERRAHACIGRNEFPAWKAAVADLKNPIRRALHRVALFSGCRPSNVLGMRKGWIDLPAKRVRFPAEEMKMRVAFELPLSAALVALLTDALQCSEVLFPRSDLVFPARSRTGAVIATAVTKESTLPSNWVGYALRHSYSNAAQLAGIDGDTRQMLLAQRVAGVRGTYLSQSELFDRLLAAQESVSAKLLALLGGG